MAIRFQTIRIRGFRGRNFDLDMSKGGPHSVFVLDGNTGKTTTIELLRWCFMFKESDAIGKFRHMWANPAHVLDFVKSGKQECFIQVEFTDEADNHYKFERRVIGKHNRSKENDPSRGDSIKSLSDSLEINRGQDAFAGDKVNAFLNDQFKLRSSAEYFCFDGEKARDMIRMASSRAPELIDLIRARTTHTQVQAYLDSLQDLKDRLLLDTNATLSDRAQKRLITQIRDKKKDRDESAARIAFLKDEKAVCERQVEELCAEIKQITERIQDAKSETVRRRMELEKKRYDLKLEMSMLRNEVFQRHKDWVLVESLDFINETKERIRERGKLPEPYHQDLIEACLEEPPTCQICNRPLDEESLNHVKLLGKQIASHEVQKFLTTELAGEESEYNIGKVRKRIIELVKLLKGIDSEYGRIALTSEEESLFNERLEKEGQERQFNVTLGETKQDLKVEKELLEMYNDQLNELYKKSSMYKKNKPLLERIEQLQKALELAHDNMRKRTIEVIGEVISKAVTGILGKGFSAILTEEQGLMLGEDGIFGPEVGGYS